jgi:hypothetical protein
MSDILSPVTNLKFQDCIHLTTDNSPKFVNKLSVDTTAVALTLEISSHFFFKDLLKQLVFLLDKFCVSDAAYHELCIIYDDMPRNYLLIQCRENINKIYHTERLPGNKPGAMINLNSELSGISFTPLVKRRNFSHEWKKSQIFNRDSCKFTV